MECGYIGLIDLEYETDKWAREGGGVARVERTRVLGGLQKVSPWWNTKDVDVFNVFDLFLFWCVFLVSGARLHFVALWIRVCGGGAGETRGIDEGHEFGDASKACDA